MLSKRIARSLQLLLRQKASFSGGHDHDHDHGHNYHVEVNKQSTWIKYNSVILPSRRIPSSSRSMEWKIQTKSSLPVKIVTPSNTFAIHLSSHIIAWSITTPGSMMTPMNLTTPPPSEATSMDRTLLKADSSTVTPFLSVSASASSHPSSWPLEISSSPTPKPASTIRKSQETTWSISSRRKTKSWMI